MLNGNGVRLVARGQPGRSVGGLHPQQPVIHQPSLQFIRMDSLWYGEGPLKLPTHLSARAPLLMSRHHLQLVILRLHRNLLRPEAGHVEIVVRHASAVAFRGDGRGDGVEVGEQAAGIVTTTTRGHGHALATLTGPHDFPHLLVHPGDGIVHVSQYPADMASKMMRKTGRVTGTAKLAETVVQITPRGEIPIGRGKGATATAATVGVACGGGGGGGVVATKKREQRHMELVCVLMSPLMCENGTNPPACFEGAIVNRPRRDEEKREWRSEKGRKRGRSGE